MIVSYLDNALGMKPADVDKLRDRIDLFFVTERSGRMKHHHRSLFARDCLECCPYVSQMLSIDKLWEIFDLSATSPNPAGP